MMIFPTRECIGIMFKNRFLFDVPIFDEGNQPMKGDRSCRHTFQRKGVMQDRPYVLEARYRLVQQYPEIKNSTKILDLTCGVGFSTRMWRYLCPDAYILANDLDGMVAPYIFGIPNCKFTSEDMFDFFKNHKDEKWDLIDFSYNNFTIYYFKAKPEFPEYIILFNEIRQHTNRLILADTAIFGLKKFFKKNVECYKRLFNVEINKMEDYYELINQYYRDQFDLHLQAVYVGVRFVYFYFATIPPSQHFRITPLSGRIFSNSRMEIITNDKRKNK